MLSGTPPNPQPPNPPPKKKNTYTQNTHTITKKKNQKQNFHNICKSYDPFSYKTSFIVRNCVWPHALITMPILGRIIIILT